MENQHRQSKGYTFYLTWFCLSFVMALSGCASVNPFAVAETPTQQVYALESTYNIVLAQAVKALQMDATSLSTKDKIRRAERRATPAIESLSSAFKDYRLALIQINQGQTPDEKIEILAANLERYITQAEAAIANLSATIQ